MRRRRLWPWLRRWFEGKTLLIGVMGVMGVIGAIGVIGGKTKKEEMILPVAPEMISWEKDLKLHLFEVEQLKWVSAEKLEVQLKNGVVVIFSPLKDRGSQFNSLQLVLDQTKIKDKPVKRIDLRFDKPVLIYE